MELAVQRRFFAEEIEAVANVKTAALIEALATVPRERFLPPGPWMLKSEMDLGAAPRLTPDANPRRVHHNIAVGIDPARMLFNGQPAFLALLIDALALGPGSRVLHVGCGLGYYSAIIAHTVGPSGRVVAIDVDEALVVGARANLSSVPWVEVHRSDGTAPLGDTFDAILVNAGVTHPPDNWLQALSADGRIILPITFASSAMGAIGKGTFVLVTRSGATFGAKAIAVTAIYSAVGVRDDALNAAIGLALQQNPLPRLTCLRRDDHERAADCWLHGDTFCFSCRA